MADEWNENLKCPRCQKRGIARLRQAEDEMPTALDVPDGFKVVKGRYGIDFHCESCKVPVLP
jgi:hypothetical protein